MYKVNNFKSNNLNETLKHALKTNALSIYNDNDELIIDLRNNILDVLYNNHLFKVDKANKRYVYLPIKYYPKSSKSIELEYHTGAYNYLYSKVGFNTLEAFINLDNATYTLSDNNTKYNGYVLFNHKTVDELDVGLTIRHVNDEVVVQPFYYYMGGLKEKVFYLDSIVLSKFEFLNEKTFKGTDNFKVFLTTTKDGWYFKIDVLNKDISYEKYIRIEENMHQKEGRFLVGSSLVPVSDTLWDPLCAASFKNVNFEEILLNSNTYLYPTSKAMEKGFSQGYPFASYKLTNHSFIFETQYE
ncbi:hypothetical protein [Acholeplasma hippikon]|uniref:Uncharacterized protein n=1 Tax=Acholeplasma hippikon TaxID=264636 RepID=A0A449BLB9_9MOLU|nr:hypothetical protein [Acholeplasma hippikon]VEU83224.1 Uncharacterised protein [Acholeplasma hippikon]